MKNPIIKKIISVLITVILLSTIFPVNSMASETSAAEETTKEGSSTLPSAGAVPVKGVSLDTESAIIRAGRSLYLKAKIAPENASNKKIKWESSNKDVAKVSEDGKVTGLSYGTATITAKTVEGNFSAACEIKVQFLDLGEDLNGIYAPIYWAVDQKIIVPENKSMFLPNSTCTRETMISYIYNLMEKPSYNKGTTYKDVTKNNPCYDAISWAQENNLLENIVEKNIFAGGKSLNKEELATILYRLSDSPYVGYDGLFVDVKKDSYFKDAVNWAVENNIIDDYREPDGSSSYLFGCGDKLVKEDAAIFLYNYTHEKNPGFAEDFFAANTFPVLMNGMEVPDELYEKYTNPQYCAEVFAYYALQEGWQYEAIVGALAYMWQEGMSAKGTFTYEGCWSVTGPSGAVQDKTLNNSAWREWVHSENCRTQMISHTSYYSSSHYAIGLGYCGESNVWNVSGGRWKQMVNNCDSLLSAADISGVAWQDINFQTKRALSTITSCSYDPDWRNPTTFSGDAREYCARVFATVGYTGFSVWYDNGQLGDHINKVDVVRPFVDNVINHTSRIENDLVPNTFLY